MMDGLLLVDKPCGPSSSAVVQRVRRKLGVARAGHTGTLDPRATGLLVVMIGRATRLLQFLPDEPKRYRTVVRFGVSTTTDDVEGDVCGLQDPGVQPPSNWDDVCDRHRGVLELPVPAYAAVKRQGRRLYQYARAGEAVPIPQRRMDIRELREDAGGWPWVRLELVCSGGTYVRSLAAALGRATGFGAYVASLRRTRVGRWSVDRAATPERLEDAWDDAFIPMDEALEYPPLVLDDDQVGRIATGRAPERVRRRQTPGLHLGERFTFTDRQGRLLAVAKSCTAWEPSTEPPEFEFERVMLD